MFKYSIILLATPFLVSTSFAVPLNVNGALVNKPHNQIPEPEGANGVDVVGKVRTITSASSVAYFDQYTRLIKQVSEEYGTVNTYEYIYSDTSQLPIAYSSIAKYEGGRSAFTTRYHRDEIGRLISSIDQDGKVSKLNWTRQRNGKAAYTLDATKSGFGFIYREFSNGKIVAETITQSKAMLCTSGGKIIPCSENAVTEPTNTSWEYKYHKPDSNLILSAYNKDTNGHEEIYQYYKDGYLYRHARLSSFGRLSASVYKDYKLDTKGNWVERTICKEQKEILKDCSPEKRTFTYY